MASALPGPTACRPFGHNTLKSARECAKIANLCAKIANLCAKIAKWESGNVGDLGDLAVQKLACCPGTRNTCETR